MLSIGRMASGQNTYYLDLAREDYYLEGGEPPGIWWGRGAEKLGLTGTVERRQLERIFAGYTSAGEPLVQNAGKDHHRPGFDLTFSAPKSVSVFWALTDENTRHRMQEAHQAAVIAALSYFEDEVACTRRGSGGSQRVSADIITALFEHSTSRALNPLLHTHALLMNVVVDHEGKPGTLDARYVYRLKMALGAIYRAALSYGLHELRLPCERKQSWFELESVSPKLCEMYSKRRAEILAALGRLGLESASAAAFAALASREPKDIVPPRAELFTKWRTEARDAGWTGTFEAEQFRARGPLPKATLDAVFEEAVTAIADKHSHFSSHDLVRFVAEASQTKGISPHEIRSHVRQSLIKSPLIVSLGDSQGELRYTTRQTLDIEENLLRRVKQMTARTRRRVSESKVQSVLRKYATKRSALLREATHHVTQLARQLAMKRTRRFDRDTVREASSIVLHGGQMAAVRHLTSNELGDVRILAGMTGAGKTTVLAAVREVFERSGFKVRGVTAMPRARDELQRRSGIEADTFSSLMRKMNPSLLFSIRHHAKQFYRATRRRKTSRLKRVKFNRKTVLVVDGAESFATSELGVLVKAVKESGGLLILVGDKHLRQPIGPGGAFATLCERIAHPTLTHSKRQRDREDIELVHAVAEGRIEAVRENLTKRKTKTIEPTTPSIQDLVQSLEDRVRLTVADNPQLAIKSLISDWIETEGRRPKSGMIFCGTRHEADKVNEQCQAERLRRLHLFPGVRIGVNGGYIYKGDRVVLRKNANARFARSGTTGTVTGVNPILRRVTVKLDNNERIVLPLLSYKHRTGKRRGKVALDLCYAVAASDDWGTVDRSYVLTGEICDRETLYAQLSRAREKTRVYTSDATIESFWSGVAITRQKSLAHTQLAREEETKAPRLEEQPTISR
ncbi:MAG: MobF family relaxase [Phycisphaerae bacterium]|nr:MobF family relaxase [Phycisphaerae bacterium]